MLFEHEVWAQVNLESPRLLPLIQSHCSRHHLYCPTACVPSVPAVLVSSHPFWLQVSWLWSSFPSSRLAVPCHTEIIVSYVSYIPSSHPHTSLHNATLPHHDIESVVCKFVMDIDDVRWGITTRSTLMYNHTTHYNYDDTQHIPDGLKVCV